VTTTCPVWLIKTRMQLQTSAEGSLHRYSSTWDCVKQTYQHEGYRGFYKGLGASYLGIAESSLQLVLYERFKAMVQHYRYKHLLESNTSGALEIQMLESMKSLARLIDCASRCSQV